VQVANPRYIRVKPSELVLDIGYLWQKERTLKKNELIRNLTAADLIVESRHPIRGAGLTAVRDVALGLKTSHLVFPGGIGGSRRTSLSLRLEVKVFASLVWVRDREGEPAWQQADHEPFLRL
jgi:hypothetical protein